MSMKGFIMEKSNGIWAKSQTTKLLVCLSFLLVALLGAFAVVNGTSLKAQAADETASSNVVNVKVTHVGNEGGASANLERSTYVEGDSLVLTWKGAAVGDDFVIPTKIEYGNDNGTTWNTSTLISVDQMQVDNDRYSVRMDQSGNMTSYDSLKNYVTATHTISLGTVAALSGDVKITWQKVAPVYRMYNMITSEHLFTTNKGEYDGFLAKDLAGTDVWICEGISWLAPKAGTVVHRLYNPTLGAMGHSSHYYTADEAEIATLTGTAGWVDDGVEQQFYSGGNTAIYTCYNGLLGSSHHYTTSKTEWEGLKAHGWDLEESKNGTNGVFQGVIGTSWSYSDNYYKVEHYYENGSSAFATQWVEGKAGQRTAAKALSIPGYEQTNVGSATIAVDNTTAVSITYSKVSYTLTLKNANGSGSDLSQKVKYQGKPNIATPNNTSSLTFAGWYLDAAFTVPYNAETTMPAGNVTLYAKWNDVNVGTTSYAVHHKLNGLNGGNSTYLEPTAVKDVAVGSMTNVAAYVQEHEGFTAKLPQDVQVEANGQTVVEIVYERNVYEVTFIYDANVIKLDADKQSVEFEATADKPVVSLVDDSYDLNTISYSINGNSENVFGKQIKANTEITITINKKSSEDKDDKGDTDQNQKTSYKIEHYQKALGEDAYTLESTDTVADVLVGSQTDVASRLKTYEGFGNASYDGEVTVQADDKTVVKVYYNRNTYVVQFQVNESHLSVDPKSARVEFGATVAEPSITELDSENYKFDKWVELRTDEGGNQSLLPWDFTSVVSGNLNLVGLTTKIEKEDGKDDGTTPDDTDKDQDTDLVKYTITYAGNGATSGVMRTDSRVVGDGGRLTDNSYFKKDGENYYGFRWWEGPDGTKYKSGYTGDIKGVTNGANITLKAIWTDTVLTGDYWFAPASKTTTGNTTATANQANPNYTHPYNDVVKTHEEFQKDINKLERYVRGDRASAVVAIYNEYKSYMDNDNYHLYMRLNKTSEFTPTGNPYNDNDFAECRILQIGYHLSTGDGKGWYGGKYSDGSTVTFQMTHALPVAREMRYQESFKTARYGWGDSSMNTHWLGNTNGSGVIADLFPYELKRATNLAVNKWYAKEVKDWASMQESVGNKLWLASVSEMAQLYNYNNNGSSDQISNSAALAGAEGDQYAFWKNLGTTSGSTNPALQGLGKLRSGSNLKATYTCDWWTGSIHTTGGTTNCDGYTWTRTFARNGTNLDNQRGFNIVDNTGNANSAFYAYGYCGVTVCFAFQGNPYG